MPSSIWGIFYLVTKALREQKNPGMSRRLWGLRCRGSMMIRMKRRTSSYEGAGGGDVNVGGTKCHLL